MTNMPKTGVMPGPISPKAFKQVSDFRREQIKEKIATGTWATEPMQEKTWATTKKEQIEKTSLGTALAITKKANTTGSHTGWTGSSDTVRQSSELYSPLLLHSNFNFPRDRATINAWCRSFFAINPYVMNAISLHSTYPVSKMTIKCKNPHIENFFKNMCEEIGLANICMQIAQEYWTVGEAIVYADLDENARKWKSISITNPDYVVIQNSIIPGEPIISLRPDENLKRICTSNKPIDIQQRQKLSPNIVEHVRKGENIPLSNFNTSHLARRVSPYELRGSSIIISIFRSLMMFDKIRECKFAQTESMINPLTLIKIGGAEHKPTPAELQQWRDQFEAAQSDKDFKLLTHQEVEVTRVGANSAVMDTSSDVAALIKEIYIGLFTPSVVLEGGTEISMSNGTISLEILKNRYIHFQNILSDWLRRKIFYPISEINDFSETVNGEIQYIVPEIDWNHMNLFDTDTYVQNLITLTGEQDKRAPKQTLYRSLGLDYQEVNRKLKEEAIDAIILKKEIATLEQMTLADLKTLDPNEDIEEILEKPVPGETLESNSNDVTNDRIPGMEPAQSPVSVPPPPQ